MENDNLSLYTVDRSVGDDFDIFKIYNGVREFDKFLEKNGKQFSYVAHIDEWGIRILDNEHSVEVAFIEKRYLTFDNMPILEALNTDIDTLKCEHQFKGFYDSDILVEICERYDLEDYNIDQIRDCVIKIKEKLLLFLLEIGKHFEAKKVA